VPSLPANDLTVPPGLRPAPMPGVAFGKYRLLRELALGGMARIYLATSDGPGGFLKPCVIKKILPEFAKRADFSEMFINEARIAALLSHPNIVQAFDFGEVEGDFFLALEWVDGASLASVISACKRRGAMPDLNITTHVGMSLCEALSYAHAARDPSGEPLNIVHRDVTPGNVLISTSGAVKLTDFGIVKSSINATHSRPNVLKGKLAYMAPEQIQSGQFDARTDLYSLALVLYELATGRRPFERATLAQSLAAASQGSLPRPSEFMPFPSHLERILCRALAVDPKERYPTAHSLLAALDAFRAEQPWMSPTHELAQLLRELYPKGCPAGARALNPPRSVTALARPPKEGSIAFAEADDVIEVMPAAEGFVPHSWRDPLWAVAAGLIASASFWLFLT